ncbi:armadillo-type protein [Roridomyces roridus]|uniref:Armadillo-type protein n=1 Tax=Roridomyces roridus TaxID=1738132 RepID=A0AAD7FLW3_9AGAR|nr:armadillo-type protein [Roridomyces roridus]
MNTLFGRRSKLLGSVARPLKTRQLLEQTRDLIRANAGIQLTQKSVEIFKTHLIHEHTSVDTRILVLVEFSRRAKIEENVAVLVDFLVGDRTLFEELLQSTEPKVKTHTCILIGNLADHSSVRDTVLLCEPCEPIVKLLRDSDFLVRDAALYALIKLCISADGVHVVMQPETLDLLVKLLDSRRQEERVKTCKLFCTLSEQQTSIPVLSSLNLPRRFVALTRESDVHLRRSATRALSIVCRSPPGAQAIAEAEVVPRLDKLLHSSDTLTRASACQIVGQLVMHKNLTDAILKIRAEERLVDLIDDPADDVCRSSAFALSNISQTIEGARAVANARAPERAVVHLRSTNIEQLRSWVCHIMMHLARHLETLPAVLKSRPCPSLLLLLSDRNTQLRQLSLGALSNISRWAEGAAAVVEAQVAAKAGQLLYDPETKIRAEACRVIGNLAIYDATAAAATSIEPYQRLVLFLSDPDDDIRRCAVYALAKISKRPDDAEAVVEAGGLHDCQPHLESPVLDIRKFTCELLGNVAQHEETLAWVISVDPCPQLVRMLSDTNIEIGRAAAAALAKMSMWPDGAAAVGAAKAVNAALPLLQSPDAQMERSIAEMFGNLVRHRQAIVSFATLSVGDLVANANVDDTGRIISENIRLRARDDSPLAPDLPQIFQTLGQLLGSTPHRRFASNLMQDLLVFLAVNPKDKDVGRYFPVFRVLMVGSASESLRGNPAVAVLAPASSGGGLDTSVRPIDILENISAAMDSEEVRADVGLAFCACWVLIQLARYQSR